MPRSLACDLAWEHMTRGVQQLLGPGADDLGSRRTNQSLFLSPLSLYDLHLQGAHTCCLHGHVGLATTWPVALGTPHTGSRREPERSSTAKPCGRKRTLSGRVLLWTVLQYGAEILHSGLCPGPTEDKTGLFPWPDRWRWDTEKSGGEPL